MRIRYLSEFMSATDVTWMMGPVFIWSTIEPSVAVVCACLPHLAPLARLAHRSILSRFHSQRTIGISSARGGLHNGSGCSLKKGYDNNRAPMFDYGVDNMKKSANDDEIGLTNYITVGINEAINPSSDSISEHIGHNHSIAVHSSLVQSASPRPPW
mgnify:FL=1